PGALAPIDGRGLAPCLRGDDGALRQGGGGAPPGRRRALAGGDPMLMTRVDRYLAIRRAAGFALVPIDGSLRHCARFATARGATSVVAPTAIAWATLAPSEAQRADRLQTVLRVARVLHAEDPRHEMPPVGVCRGSRPPPP